MSEQHYKLNPFFRATLGEKVTLELPLEREIYECEDVRVLSALSLLDGDFHIQDAKCLLGEKLGIEDKKALHILQVFIDIHIVVSTSYQHKDLAAALHWNKRNWMEAFYLHAFSKNLPYAEITGNDKNSKKMYCKAIADGELKLYEAPEHIVSIVLPEASKLPTDRSLRQILKDRRCNEPWTHRELTIQKLSNILWYANREGVRARQTIEHRSLQSPETILEYSAFSSLESRICLLKPVETIDLGIYHYDLKNHALLLLKKGYFEESLVKMCIGQQKTKGATLSIALIAYWSKYFDRYSHPRAYRTLFVNAGELMQKYLLLATTYRFSQFITPAFKDNVADELFETNGYETAPIYALSIG